MAPALAGLLLYVNATVGAFVSITKVVPVGAALVFPAASAVVDKLTVAVPST